MKETTFIILFIFVLLHSSCASHRSGRYEFQGGRWVFIKSNTGFSHLGFDLGRVDNKDYALIDSGEFIWPVPSSKKVSSHFGNRRGRHHDGIDIVAVTGTHIVASAGGVVTIAGQMRGYGNVIVIKHSGGHHTIYAHNSKHFVKKGQKVSQGEVIGQVGSTGRSTGPHLHFEIRRKNKVRNPKFYLAHLKKH